MFRKLSFFLLEGAGQLLHLGMPFLRNLLEKARDDRGFLKEGVDLFHALLLEEILTAVLLIEENGQFVKIGGKPAAETPFLLFWVVHLFSTVIDPADLERAVKDPGAILNLRKDCKSASGAVGGRENALTKRRAFVENIHRQYSLFFAGEERDISHLVQVDPKGIGRRWGNFFLQRGRIRFSVIVDERVLRFW